MQQRILIIDDNVKHLKLMRSILEIADYEVHIADDGQNGLHTFYQTRPDLVILDILMPGLDGWQVCQRIRTICNTPIMMLTALGTDNDICYGLELGADTYLVKPISTLVLLARIQAILRRVKVSAKQPQFTKVITFERLSLNIEYHKATYDNNPIRLSPIEFKLLACLMKSPGHILSHEYILRTVWGGHQTHNRNVLRSYIKRLRQKLSDATGMDDLIQVHWQAGYRLG